MDIAVKICGIVDIEAADAAVGAGADYVGLVFHPGSPRFVRPALAEALARRLRGRARIVALTADATDDAILQVVDLARPDLIQLHGKESPARVGAVRSRFGIPVIKALGIAEPGDLSDASRYEGAADMLLFDAKAPEAAHRPGGHGAAYDWRLLRTQSFSTPWFLAGGLTPANVARAIRASGASAVDVSSGVESSPGLKDPQRIREFVAAARAAQIVTEAEA